MLNSKGKVLIVDDDELVLKVTCARLEEAGYEVHCRNNPLGSSELIYSLQPDVLILDLKMPGLSGERLGPLLKERFPKLRVVLHSSANLLELQQAAVQMGAVGAISKTDNSAVFIAQFERLMCRKV